MRHINHARRERYGSRVTGRIDRATKSALVQIAAETGLDESDLVRLALRQFLPTFAADLDRPPVLTGNPASNVAAIVADSDSA